MLKNFTGNLHVILIKKQFPSHYSHLFVYIKLLILPRAGLRDAQHHPGFPCSQLLYFHSIGQASEFRFGVRFQ